MELVFIAERQIQNTNRLHDHKLLIIRGRVKMKNLKRSFIILIVAMVIGPIIPIKTSAESVEPPRELITEQLEQQEPVGILIEDKEKREENTKVFQMTDRSYQAAVYQYPVHFQEDGEWKDIDNTLQEEVDIDTDLIETSEATSTEVNSAAETEKSKESNTEGTNKPKVESSSTDATSAESKNNTKKKDSTQQTVADEGLGIKQNEFKIHFSKNTTKKKLVKIKQADFTISWNLDGIQQTSPVKEKVKIPNEERFTNDEKKQALKNLVSSVVYPEALPNVDLEYKVISKNVKENIIFKKKSDNSQLTFTYNVKGVTPKIENNMVSFYSDADPSKVVYQLSAPIMFDANGAKSTDIVMGLAQKNKKTYQLTVTPNAEWLNASERKYPVTVDPTVITDTYAPQIYDSYVAQYYPNSNFYLKEWMRMGMNGEGINRGYIKFTLPTISSANVITNAQINLGLYNTKASSSQINVHKVTKDWASETITWNNMATYDPIVTDYSHVSGTWGGTFDWNITDIVKKWYTSEPNYGLMFKAADESANFTEVFASDTRAIYDNYRPVILISYVNNNGLEDNWSYHSQELSRAGTGYVNDYSGNLTWEHNDLDMSGNRAPINLTHYFNSNDRLAWTAAGYGWRLNYGRHLAYNSELNQYSYVDDDGTIHYFSSATGGSPYTDESGLNITLEMKNASAEEVWVIKDKAGDVLNFDANGRLMKCKTANNNAVTVQYVSASSWDISKLIDGAGRVVALTYDGSGQLTKITDPSGRATQYAYTGWKLTGITYPDGKQASFTYDANNNLINVKDIDGQQMNYSYTSVAPYRVALFAEGVSGKQYYGTSVAISYGFNTTSFSDNSSRKEVYQFDHSGNTKMVRDAEGDAEYYKYNLAKGANKNKMTAVSKLQKTTMNYLLNHNFERGVEYWNVANETGSTGSGSAVSGVFKEGNVSLSVKKTNTVLSQGYKQSVTLPLGQDYVLSGQIKTTAVSATNKKGAAIYLAYTDQTGTRQIVRSSYVNGTKDWTWVEAAITLPSNATSNTVDAYLVVEGETGTANFDCLQLEKGKVSSRYNIIENSDYHFSQTYWGANGNSYCGVANNSPLTPTVFVVPGKATEANFVYQSVPIAGKKGDQFTLSGWAKANSVALKNTDRVFGLAARFFKTDGTDQMAVVPFNEDSTEWQYLSDTVVANGDYKSVYIYGLYYGQENTATFDGIQLYREPFESTISYDANGNVVADAAVNGDKTKYTYNANNDVTEYIDEEGNKTTFSYDAKHNLIGSESSKKVNTALTYDGYGNAKTTTTQNKEKTIAMEASATYTADANYQASATDEVGNTSLSEYDLKKGNLTSATDAAGNKTQYTYDPNTDGLLSTTSTVDGKSTTNSFGYTNDLLTSINANGNSFGFGYNEFGQNTSVSIGTKPIVTNNYYYWNHLQESTKYNNGAKISYQYDPSDRLTAKLYNDAVAYQYTYDNEGNLGLLTDVQNKVTYRYRYDTKDRLINTFDSLGNSVYLGYNTKDQLLKYEFANSAKKYTTDFTYDSEGNPTSVKYNQGDATNARQINYTYDGLDRQIGKAVSKDGTNPFNTTITYKTGTGTGKTTSLIDSVQNGSNKLTYTYDKLNNIKTVTDNGKVITYTYNEQSELTREDNQAVAKTYVYTYDVRGNILTKKVYAFTTGTPANPQIEYAYQYGDTNWKDKLTAITKTTYTAGVGSAVTTPITYDANLIGQPTTMDGNTMTWSWGTQLATLANAKIDAKYTYDESGTRTSKTVTDKATGKAVTTSYVLDGDKVVYESDGTNKIYYTRDSAGNLLGINVNGVEYTYIFSQQNDVIGIIDNSGTLVVSYQYDAWGNIESTTGSLKDTVGKLNPYRYRSYRYDEETKWYYLQSRYYVPEIGRMLSADDVEVTTVTPENPGNDKNLFAYCDNNPVMRADTEGQFWHFIVGAVVGGVINATKKVVSNVRNGVSWHKGIFSSFGSGALSGALSMTGWGRGIQAFGNGMLSAVQTARSGGSFGEVIRDGLIGGAEGAYGGRGSGKLFSSYGKKLNKKIIKKITHPNTTHIKKSISYYKKSTKTNYKRYVRKTVRKSIPHIARTAILGY